MSLALIQKQFEKVLKEGRTALMTHIVAGYPNIRTSSELVVAMERGGADFVELQIPFSEPIADGPTIFQANQLALSRGITVNDSFELMKKLKEKVQIPLLFMSYYNILYRYGVMKFCRKAKQSGCSGIIVPDISPEEGNEYLAACDKYSLAPIFVIAPNSSDERIKIIAKVAKGFIYCVARTGITGKKTEFSAELKKYLKRVRKHTNLPLGVGFGIQTRRDFQYVAKYAEMGIVGSAILKIFEKKGKEGVYQCVKVLRS